MRNWEKNRELKELQKSSLHFGWEWHRGMFQIWRDVLLLAGWRMNAKIWKIFLTAKPPLLDWAAWYGFEPPPPMSNNSIEQSSYYRQEPLSTPCYFLVQSWISCLAAVLLGIPAPSQRSSASCKITEGSYWEEQAVYDMQSSMRHAKLPRRNLLK